MTNEEKDLLLKDLCARLSYGVKVADDMGRICTLTLGNVDLCSMFYGEDFDQENTPSICKPYLRPMSSMTDEEKEQIRDLWIDADTKTYATRLIDFYNKHHLDFHGLIEKGLALETPKGMYYK